MEASSRPPASRHLGLDRGGTNIKWAVVEHDAGEWRTLDRDRVATPAADGPDPVVACLAALGAEAIGRCPGVSTVGIGVPGMYDPVAGSTRVLENVPGDWAGRPVARPVEAALGIPVSLINDARAFGLAELRLGAGRGVRSMIGLTLGTGVGGIIAIQGRVHLGHDGTAGEIGHQTIDPGPDAPRCNCGNTGVSKRSPGQTGSRPPAGRRACRPRSWRHAPDARARAGMADVGRYLGIGINKWSSSSHPIG